MEVKISDKPLLLVAEDDELIRLTLEDALEEAGFASVSLTTGDEAIIELEINIERFRAVITDVRMPGEANGWAVGRRARELAPSIPVIYMTGDSAAEWAANGVPNSVLLQKPFADAQLVIAVANLLNQDNAIIHPT